MCVVIAASIILPLVDGLVRSSFDMPLYGWPILSTIYIVVVGVLYSSIYFLLQWIFTSNRYKKTLTILVMVLCYPILPFVLEYAFTGAATTEGLMEVILYPILLACADSVWLQWVRRREHSIPLQQS
jgi:hypothetical protein